MCGISGIINQDNSRVDSSDIERMNNLIIHRGPDSEGYFFDGNLALAHRRLSILDLSSDGNQPMKFSGKNGEYVIVFNGEIYNYIELKDELDKFGYRFKSNSDTEVILACYDQYGVNCVNRFNGMWSFAIYDIDKKILFCSRDRFGIKPFYYTIYNNRFIFGSEIKQLIEFFDKRYVNKEILLDYLVFELEEHSNETFFENIYKLPPSHNLIYNLDRHNFKIYRYYSLDFKDEINNLDEKHIVDRLYKDIDSAIRLRLRSDVKVGSCLSGGLDSSSIVAFASKKYQKSGLKFCAIHAKSVEDRTDESHFAKLVAQSCNLDLQITQPSLNDIKDAMDDVIKTQEEPFGGPSIVMQYFVMKRAKEIGCTVMLDGQGGDETLFGYEYYYIYYFSSLLKRFKIFKYIKDFKNVYLFRLSKKRLFIESIIAIFRDKLFALEKLFKVKRLNLKIDYSGKNSKDIYRFSSFKDLQLKEIIKTNLPALLKYEDRNSMRFSIETRLPLLDYQFVQNAISAKDELKFKNGYLKYLLRRVVEDLLPKDIVYRKSKFGFEAPTNSWIEDNIEYIKDTIKSSKILDTILNLDEKMFKNRLILWRLYSVAIWEKSFNVEIK